MKKIIYYDYGFASDDQEKIRLIKKYGFDGVFLFWRENLDETVSALREAGLWIETIHLPFEHCNDLWLEGESTSEYLSKIKTAIEDAHRFAVPTVIFHVSSSVNPPAFNETGLNRFKAILSICERYSLNLALENLRSLNYMDYLYENCAPEHLKFCFDSGHANAFTHNIEDFPWESYQDRMICLHLHDNNGLRDQHLVPMTGTINWVNLIKNLKASGYAGPLTSEAIVKKDSPISEEDFVKSVRQALDEIESRWQNEN